MNKWFRVVTASSLFDGHDASINVFRRLLQKKGLEIIHLGHNRSAKDIVTTALQEDAHAICISSYQGGHMEYFRYIYDLLKEAGSEHIGIFGGGGGTILPSEIEALQAYGIQRLYHANDGQNLGLEGIIDDLISRIKEHPKRSLKNDGAWSDVELAQHLTAIEEGSPLPTLSGTKTPVLGITGTGGAGKSSLVDELIHRFLLSVEDGRIAVLAFDPTKKKTGGALLGDRIRMNSIYSGRVFFRSMATRGSEKEMGEAVERSLQLLRHVGFKLVILETSGIGQGGAGIVELSDHSLYVMTSEYGASTQLEKIDMIDYADSIAINKFDKLGAEEAFNDVAYAYRQSHGNVDFVPVFATIASNFNNPGVTELYLHIMKQFFKVDKSAIPIPSKAADFSILPPERSFYLGEIASTVRDYHTETTRLADLASRLYKLDSLQHDSTLSGVENAIESCKKELGQAFCYIEEFHKCLRTYQADTFEFQVRDKSFSKSLIRESLSGTQIKKIATPRFKDWGDQLRWIREENYPGRFPYTAGVFELKREDEDPKRQFAGEGGPARTNKRFHYLSDGEDAKRLSTAFDSVTLYGEDPAARLDIYGKVGNSGVSIATLEHMKTLYKGFDLIHPNTSVSMTINGPAPIILAMFLNTAIDFEMEKNGGDYEVVKSEVLEKVRGTVQADILKEEQAQNTCIFSSRFALKMMGDIQEYFIQKKVRNFYSVSISGYHIAEAGANPISQVAFTLANGFTYVEYYLARGMHIDDFASNLSFFFSTGLDPEYAVIGRVARRIWAITLRDKYGANARSAKLKYHIQTSGRSLHAQEIAFNDIRTTLQALLAIYDNCNSLHTNAYDEAITTPTEESVRRAMAIQLILTKEFGPNFCENACQGSFFYEELTSLVEEAILTEFDRLSRRGGVLGAMEKQYQRHRIQSESMKYETLKNSGELPIVGVNTFLGKENTDYEHIDVIRANEEEKQEQIRSTCKFIDNAGEKNKKALQNLRQVALSGGNIFEELMETVKWASLGQITHVLYSCGGEYRRSM